MPQALRSILAVVAGYVSMAIVVMLLTAICMKAFHLTSGNPTPVYLTLNILYSLAAAALGGYVAALIARPSPLAHGIALGALILVLSLVSFRTSAGDQPFGYRIFLVICPPLAAVAGSTLVKAR